MNARAKVLRITEIYGKMYAWISDRRTGQVSLLRVADDIKRQAREKAELN